MLDPRHVSDQFDEVRAALRDRSEGVAAALDPVKDLAARRRELIGRTEERQAERNHASEEMGLLKKAGNEAEFAARREKLKTLSADVKDLETELAGVEQRMEEALLTVPNVPHATTPRGKGEHDNPVVRIWGEKPAFDFEPKAHWDIGIALGLLDFERAAKLSGARFTVMYGAAARLERALVTFMLDLHTREHGYLEVYPPYLVKAQAMRGTGQLPKFEEDAFKTRRSDGDEDKSPLYLVPTAEVPLTNLHADEILETPLPVAYCAFTPCFRAEAGNYGKDTRGLIRQHQFDKVELVRFVEPEASLEELERLTRHAQTVLERLGLHYRVIELCSGDLGFSATKTYDLEVWLPGQSAYREISSCSSFGDYQARRARIRYRPASTGPKKAKPRLVHTLNGSGLAVGRTLVAILEQYQRADGTVTVPEVLRGFMGTDSIRARA